MTAMFGDAFWDFTIIGVSHWAFDSNSIAERNHTGKNEEWFLAQWNKQFKDKFHMEKDLSGVFIDSWSQQPWNIEDPGQQDIFHVSFYLGTHSKYCQFEIFGTRKDSFKNHLLRGHPLMMSEF